MLKQVHLQNFKKFKDVTVELRPFTVLMGENSSGKTSVLQSINLALDIFCSHKLIEIRQDGGTIIRDTGIPLSKMPGINLADSRDLFYAKKTGGNSPSAGICITLNDTSNNNYRLQIRLLYGAFNIKCISATSDFIENPNIHRKSPLFISGFVGLLSSEERLFPAAMQDRLRTGQISIILRNLLLDTQQKNPQRFKQLVQRLKQDFNFDLGNLSFDENSDVNITATYNELSESGSLPLDLNSSGSGFMQVLQIIAPIYRYCPDQCSIVLLDEPDAHLHPNLQASLANTLRNIQQELEIQIIISTHSTSIIRAADPTEVVPISSKSKVNTFLAKYSDVEEEIYSRIDNYELGKTIISGKIIFFEDSKIDIFEAFDQILGTKCFSGPNTVPILKGKGKDNEVPFKIYEVLKKMLDRDVEIHFIRDGDGLSEEWRKKLQEYSNNNKVTLHHLELHEIENYILCPKLFFKALRSKYPNKNIPSEQDIKTKMLEVLKNTIELSRYKFEQNLEDSLYKTGRLVESHYGLNEAKGQATKLREKYEQYNHFDDLVRVGMGKEAIKEIFKWLNEQGLNVSKKDITGHLDETDIPDEIKIILRQLQSKESK